MSLPGTLGILTAILGICAMHWPTPWVIGGVVFLVGLINFTGGMLDVRQRSSKRSAGDQR